MKVFVIVQAVSYDYEGTDTEIIGIYSSEKLALGRVRKDIPNAKRGEVEWPHPDNRGDNHVWSIEKWEVDQ